MAKGPVFRLTPENALRSELQAGKVRPAYFFYGEEDFLTRTYTDMVIKTAGALEGDGLNLLRFRGVPDMDKLSDFAESMPFFAPNKCVRITDLDPESLDNQQLKDMIKLVEELPETTVIVFALITTALDDAKPKLLFAGNCGAALRMLDDLFQQRMEPVLILSAVSGAFVDCYRGKLAVRAGKSSQQAAADFGYFGGRAYYFGKACTKARGLSDGYLNACMEVLFRTNRLMNSSKTDSRLLLERAFTEISALKGARV